MTDYLKWIRSKVQKECIILNFAGGIVKNGSGGILLQKRSSVDEHWGFPGGAMNLGESAEETAIREIKEETGFEVCVENLFGIYTKFIETAQNGDKFQSIVIVFKMKIIGDQKKIDNIESFDIQFFEIDQLPKLYSPLHRLIMEDYKSGKVSIYR